MGFFSLFINRTPRDWVFVTTGLYFLLPVRDIHRSICTYHLGKTEGKKNDSKTSLSYRNNFCRKTRTCLRLCPTLHRQKTPCTEERCVISTFASRRTRKMSLKFSKQPLSKQCVCSDTLANETDTMTQLH